MKTVQIHLILTCFFIFSFLSCNQQKEQKIEQTVNVQPEMVLDLVDLQSKNKLGKDTVVTVSNDPVYHKTKKYQAVNALFLLKNEIDLSKVDIKNTLIVFECIDGYKPEMPLELFLKTNPFLAFKDVDAPKGSNWEKIVKNGNEIKFYDEVVVQLAFSNIANIFHHTEQLTNSHVIRITADLRHVTNLRPIGRVAIDQFTIHKYFPGRWLYHAKNALDQRGFSGTVRPDQ